MSRSLLNYQIVTHVICNTSNYVHSFVICSAASELSVAGQREKNNGPDLPLLLLCMGSQLEKDFTSCLSLSKRYKRPKNTIRLRGDTLFCVFPLDTLYHGTRC